MTTNSFRRVDCIFAINNLSDNNNKTNNKNEKGFNTLTDVGIDSCS